MANIQRTVCDPNCHATPKCGLSATIEDDKIIAVSAADYPLDDFKNRICLMGRSRLEYQYHPDRLKKPLKRVGKRGDNKWDEISWDEALTIFVENHKRIIDTYGEKAVAMTQVSGAWGILTRGAMHRYAALTGATVSAAGGIDYALPKGLEYMFGIPAMSYFQPGGHAITDVMNSDVTILWGTNMAITRSVDHAPIKSARKNGTRLICIDPTNSETAALCDEWVSIRPGSDGALAWAIANQIISHKRYDSEFLINHTDMPYLINIANNDYLREKDLIPEGSENPLVWCEQSNAPVTLEQAKSPTLVKETRLPTLAAEDVAIATAFSCYSKEAKAFDPEQAESITGVAAAKIVELAETFAKAKPAAIRMGFGIDRWYSADSTARIIATLSCLTGNIGIAGGGVSITGGGKSVPLKGSAFYAPDGKKAMALSMMEVDDCVRKSEPFPIRMECVALGNPYNQVKPDRANVLKEYISKLEFICVIDHFMTDTAKQADLVLPACTIFERTDIIADSFLQLQQRVVTPEGEAKSDFEIFALLGEKMGYGEYFQKTEAEVIEDIINATKHPVMEDVSWERLEKEKVIYPWDTTEPYVAFKERVFPTQSKKIECFKPELGDYGSTLPVYREPIEASPKNPLFKTFPLVLLSSHSRYRIHSTFANMPLTKAKEPNPVMRMNKQDAKSRKLSDGDIVKVFNQRGNLKIKCEIDEKIRPGTVLICEGHWIDDFIEGDPYQLTHSEYSTTAENYAHYDVLVQVTA